jgi:hypothetical protein
VADFSVGPVVYRIVSELPSTRLRAKTIVLARNTYNIINLAFVNIISYRQFNQDAWNWVQRQVERGFQNLKLIKLTSNQTCFF